MKFRYFNLIILFSIMVLSIAGCKNEENPVTPPSEHFEPEGWIIRDATLKPVLVVFQGTILKTYNNAAVSDTLFAPLSALSSHYSIKFLDANKNIINPPSDADHSLGWLITNSSMLEVIQDSPTDWAFHLKGKSEGKTSIELQVRHLGHTDVITPKIPVVIAKDSTAHGEPVGVRLKYEDMPVELVSATADSSSGEIVVSKDSTTEHISIEFFDENGKYFQPEYPLHKFEIVITGNPNAEFIPDANEPWVIRVKGVQIGNTTFKLKLIVGGIAEFTSFDMKVRVN